MVSILDQTFGKEVHFCLKRDPSMSRPKGSLKISKQLLGMRTREIIGKRHIASFSVLRFPSGVMPHKMREEARNWARVFHKGAVVPIKAPKSISNSANHIHGCTVFNFRWFSRKALFLQPVNDGSEKFISPIADANMIGMHLRHKLSLC